MDFESFTEYIRSSFEQMMGESASVTLQQVIKNNDVVLDALTIMPVGQNITPSIYLNEYYEKYKNGTPIGDIINEINHTYEAFKPEYSLCPDTLTQFSQASRYIAYKLINYETNRQLLATVPHIPYLDLAIVFYLFLKNEVMGETTALIHQNHLDMWGISLQELYRTARENTPRLLNPCFVSMGEMMQELLSEQFPDSQIRIPIQPGGDTDNPRDFMYVLTNSSRRNGAAVILYQNALENISRILNSDFYILPSSVHEVILLPYDEKLSRQELSEMIQEINSAEVEMTDQLSNHVYLYNREKHVIEY